MRYTANNDDRFKQALKDLASNKLFDVCLNKLGFKIHANDSINMIRYKHFLLVGDNDHYQLGTTDKRFNGCDAVVIIAKILPQKSQLKLLTTFIKAYDED